MSLGDRIRDVRISPRACVVLVLVGLLAFPPGIFADPITWVNGDGGNYSDTSNWNCGGCGAYANNGTPPGASYDAFIQGLGFVVNLDTTGVVVNSLTIQGSGPGVSPTLNTYFNGTGNNITFGSPTSNTGNVLAISNGGVLNVGSGSTAIIELSTPGTTALNDSGSQINVTDGSALTIQSLNPRGSTGITNNGNISVIGTSPSTVLRLNDGGNGSTFTIAGAGTLTLGGSGRISGTNGDESLINGTGHTIAGDGVISGTSIPLVLGSGASINFGQSELDSSQALANFTNNGTLHASTNGATLEVQANLTNWTGGSSNTLTGGTYTVDDGATLQLSSIGPFNSIQTLAGNATVNVTGAGLITGDGITNSLSGLTNISNSNLNLTGVGTGATPFQITPGGSPATLSMSADPTGTPASLTLDGQSNVTVNGGFTNSTNTIGGSANSSTLTIQNGSTLTTGAFLNQATVGYGSNIQSANSTVYVTNSTLNVASLNTYTDNGSANSTINVTGVAGTPAVLSVTGDVVQGGAAGVGPGISLGSESLNLTYATGTVGGAFANNNQGNVSQVNLTNSSLTVNGAFTQTQGTYGESQLNLNGSTMTVGGLTNGSGVLPGGNQSQVSITNGSTLTVLGDGTFTNTNTVGPGVLSGGSYFIGSGSTLVYTGADINTIDANTSLTLDNSEDAGSSLFLVNGSHDALMNSLATVNGTLTLQNGANLTLTQQAIGVGANGAINVTDNANLTLQNDSGGATTLTNSGNISIVGTSSAAGLTLDDGQNGSTFLFSGHGTLTLGGLGQLLGNWGDESLINDVNHTITGSGTIGNLNVTNNGTITASGGTLLLDVTYATSSAITNGSAGNINVNDGATLMIQNANSSGATTINNAGNINLYGSGSLVFSDLNYGNFGTFNLNGNGFLNLNGGSSTVMGYVGDETLINGNGHTIQGTGTISNLTLINNGIITANGGNLVLDVSSTSQFTGDGNSLVTNNGTMNVTDGSTLTIRDGSESSSTNVVNNGNINLNSVGGTTSLVFDAEGGTEQFILTGTGVLNMTNNANNSIQGAIYQGMANESLVNDFYHTIQGAGTISNFASFTNIGTLEASYSGSKLLVDTTANLTNWDGTSNTLTNGAYIAKNGATLQLSALGSSTIQNVVGADVAIYGTGLLTGDGNTNAASGISSIYSGTGALGEASLTLGWIHSPVTLATNSNGAFTVSADDNNNFGAGSASLELEHTTATLGGDLYNTSTTSTGGEAQSGVLLDHHANLTVNNLFNSATTANFLEQADAEVDLSRGSHLTVRNNLSNVATDNSGTVAYSQASVNLDGYSKLTVLGTYTNDSANQTGFASLNLTNNSTATVTGLFTNTGSSTVTLDQSGTGGSTLTTNGGFLNSNSGVLVLNNSTLTSANGFTNSADDSIPSALAGYSLLSIGPNIPQPPFSVDNQSTGLRASTTGWEIGNPPVPPSTATITGGLVNTASTNNNLYSVYSVVSVNGGSTLTADSLTNSATTNTPDGIWGAFAQVNVTGQSFLNVTGSLSNGSYNPIPSSGDGSFGQSVATISIDGGSSLTVGTGVSNYNSQIFLTNSSTMLVSAGGLTNSSDDNNWITYGNAILSLDASTGTITGGLQNTASTSNGGLALSTVTLNNGASLTVDSLSNTATVSSTLSPDSATANVTVRGGSTLTVTGNVSNTATVNPEALGSPTASISVDGSTLSVGGTFNNTSASLSLTNTSTATVTGLFTNDSGSIVTLDNASPKGTPPGSTLTTSGGFNNNGAVNLNYSSALNNTGRFSNVGSVNLNSGSTLTNTGTFSNSGTVSTSGSAANSINVTGAIFNTSAGTVNLNVAGDQMTATGQFKNWGMVNLNGNGASVSTNTALTSTQGFYNGNGGVVTLAAVGTPPEPEQNTQVTVTAVRSLVSAGSSFTSNGSTKNDGTIAFTGAYGTFTSTGDFNNRVNGIVSMAGTGDLLSTQGNMSNAGTVTIGDGEGVMVTGGTGYTQTAGTTTIDSTGTLTAALVDIAGGVLEGTDNGIGTIAGNLRVENNGTLDLGDPQSIDVTGTYDQVDGSTLDIFLGDAGSGNYDQVDVTGNVTIEGGSLDLSFSQDFFTQLDIEAGTVFDIIDSSEGTVTGGLLAFNNQTWDNGSGPLTFQEVINGNQLDLDVVDVSTSSTPEPSTLSMLFCAMLVGGGITWRIRRRRPVVG